MKKLKWWFRVVGVFYLLLTAMNLWAIFLGGGQMFADILPAPMNTDALAVRAFGDGWLVFAFQLGVLGAMALVASREPAKNRIMAWVIIWAEVFRGIVGDVIWITRGYDAATYAIFIVIHLVFSVTGVMFVRQAWAE